MLDEGPHCLPGLLEGTHHYWLLDFLHFHIFYSFSTFFTAAKGSFWQNVGTCQLLDFMNFL